LRDCRNARKLTLRVLCRLRCGCVKGAKRSAFGCVAVAVAVFVRFITPRTAAAPRLPLRAAFPVIAVAIFGFRFLFERRRNLFGALSPKPFVLQGDCRDRIRRARRLRYEQGGFSFASSLPC
jgi:hypothetical protein